MYRPELCIIISVFLAIGGLDTAFAEENGPCNLRGESVATRLLLGLSTSDDRQVSGEAWEQFVDTEIAPRFQCGFTIIDTAGHWFNREKQAAETERSKMLIIIHKSNAETENKINQIVRLYKSRFQQQSVIRWDSVASIN